MSAETHAQRSKRIIANMRELHRAQLEALNPTEHPNPAVRVWGMLPRTNYGGVFKSVKSMKVLGYQVGVEKRWMPVAVAKRMVKAGHCTWGLLDGDSSDHNAPGFWICAKDK